MSKIISFSLVLSFFILVGAGCGGGVAPGQNVDYGKDIKPLIDSNEQRKVRGSCNFINEQSVCIDFVGSVFTEERMKLSCQGGEFSFNTCPYANLGGCQAAGGTISESIAWSYDYGGSPISSEEAGYQAKACNALAAGKWVYPDDFLSK